MKLLEFARLAGFTNQVAHYYFREENIKRETLKEFCVKLHISLPEFYDWTGVPKPIGTPFHAGKRLNELISEKNFKVVKFAEKMGISRRALYNMFERSNFDSELVQRVSDALGITPDEFLQTNPQNQVSEDGEPHLIDWREKYYELLEIHTKILREYADYKKSQESKGL
nr:helix-turn-helix transcriptional regulator [Chitinophaga skermanii]